ncbi:MAG: FAD binding domain-containing protein, partial [Gammaproteobacteria bacterium]
WTNSKNGAGKTGSVGLKFSPSKCTSVYSVYWVDVRCWYYRRGLSCYRAGGNLCYADTPQGMNREHSLFDASRCVAAGASDTAPALVALDASMVIRNSGGECVVAAEDYFIGPAQDIVSTTVLRPGDILTAVHIPNPWANASFYWEKVAERNV